MLDVSVIIPTWNNCRRLAITLDAIARCRVPDGLRFEVIVVAKNCTDDTAAVAATFDKRLPLIFLEEARQGVSRARNAGIAAAGGELLVFADDDVRPCPEWLVLYWAAYRARGAAWFLGGPVRSEYDPEQRPGERLLQAANRAVAGFDYGPADRRLRHGEGFLEANWACAAAPVRRVGGYDPSLGLNASLPRRVVGEGRELCARLGDIGVHGYYLADAAVTHFVPAWKCTLRHLGESARASGVTSYRIRRPSYVAQDRPWLKAWLGPARRTAMAGLRLGTATIALWLRYAMARSVRSESYKAFVSLQFCLGLIEGWSSAPARSATPSAGGEPKLAGGDAHVDRPVDGGAGPMTTHDDRRPAHASDHRSVEAR